jgi:hypothetical protein
MIWAPKELSSLSLWPCYFQPIWPPSWAESTHCLAPLTFSGLHCIFVFTLIALGIILSGAPHRYSDHATHCLVYQAFLWNLSGSLHDSITCILHACKAASHGQCQAQCYHLKLTIVALECLDSWIWGNTSPCEQRTPDCSSQNKVFHSHAHRLAESIENSILTFIWIYELFWDIPKGM